MANPKGAPKKMRSAPVVEDGPEIISGKFKSWLETGEFVAAENAKELEPQVISNLKPQQSEALEPQRTDESSSKPTGRGLVERADGSYRRRLVVYIEPQAAQKLKIQSVLNGRDMSDIVNELVEKWVGEVG